MVRHKVLPFLLVVGLVSLLIPLTIALAQGDGGTVSIMDSDPNDFSGTLSDQAMIELTSLPALGADKAYEGWLVNSETGRLQSTGVLALDSNGNVSATFSLRSGDNPSGENLVAAFDTFVLKRRASSGPRSQQSLPPISLTSTPSRRAVSPTYATSFTPGRGTRSTHPGSTQAPPRAYPLV